MHSIDLIEVLIKSYRNRSILAVLIIPLIILGISLLFERTYRAETMVLRNEFNSAQDVAPGFLRNIESIVGAGSLGLGGHSQKSIAHIKTLTSKHFILHFIQELELAKEIFPDRWNEDEKRWKSKSPLPIFKLFVPEGNGATARSDGSPAPLKLYERFMGEHLSVKEDELGAMTISVTWSNPSGAARLCNAFVKEANRYIRNIDIISLQANLTQLEGQYESARIEELRVLISNLMAEQIKNVALAKSQPEYAFKVIDPALPDYSIHSPNYVGILFSALILVLIVVIIANYLSMARSSGFEESVDSR